MKTKWRKFNYCVSYFRCWDQQFLIRVLNLFLFYVCWARRFQIMKEWTDTNQLSGGLVVDVDISKEVGMINSYAFKIGLRFKFLYSIIHMTSSHIRLQNTNQPSSCFSKLSWCSQSPYESLALCLLTRIHYLGLQDRFWIRPGYW